ncbi:DUF4974 domain-containing protein [Puteibacter caeruleilacunae]|nr:DUF4974 domain-containing protein [Puteibacter caeruleilacunae]
MQKKKGIELLEKYLSGTVSSNEINELQQWLEDASHVETVSEWMGEHWDLADANANNKDEAESILLELKSKIEVYSVDRNRKTNVFSLRRWLRIASVIILPILFLGAGYFLATNSNRFHEAGDLQMIVPKGQKVQVVLADGSEVWLNSESTLTYPSAFKTDSREVKLTGEAYFKVTHNPERPFIVKTDGVDVKVLGTEFDVCNYGDDEFVQTTLVSGKVELKFYNETGKRSKPLILKPNEQATFSRKTSKVVLSQLNAVDHTGWKDGRLAFKSVAFGDLARKLERWYDVKFIFEDEELKNELYTGSFDKETFEQAINALRLSSHFNYKIKKRTVYISK